MTMVPFQENANVFFSTDDNIPKYHRKFNYSLNKDKRNWQDITIVQSLNLISKEITKKIQFSI